MRITKIPERPVGLRVGSGGGPANAVVNFSSHTVSLVALERCRGRECGSALRRP
jgi:hypothetical protein